MELLTVVVLVLLAVTLVGHGIWTAFAWLFRGGRPRSDPHPYEPTVSDDRAAAARCLRRLRSQNAIDEQTYATLLRAIADESRPTWEPASPEPRDTPGAAAVTMNLAELAQRPRPSRPPQRVKADTEPGDHAVPSRETRVEPVLPATLPQRIEPAPPPSAARRPLSEVLAAFMAEKNIRWGELVGGLLILCCSTALVISLWSKIEAIPVAKFVIFTAVTAALFGAGLFVHRRWRLPTTGYAVLMVAVLLVPLNFLAFAAFSLRGTAATGSLVVELFAVVLFAWLTLLAARVLMPAAPVLFAGGVVGLSAISLGIPAVSPLTSSLLVGAAVVPVALYSLVMGLSLWRFVRVRPMADAEARLLLAQLGVATLSCLVPVGLMVYQAGDFAGAMRQLAPVVCALTWPALLTGFILFVGLAEGVPAQMRTAAASVAVCACAVMLVGVGLAWPIPSRLLPALLVNGLAMAAASRATRYPGAHAATAAWLTAAWVLGVHLFVGSVSWSSDAPGPLLAAMPSALTGKALVGAVLVCGAIAAWLDRRKQAGLALAYAATALAFAIISTALVTAFGFAVAGDPHHITWVYLVLGAAAFLAGHRLQAPLATWVGAFLVQMAIIEGLVYVWPVRQFPWATALIAGATSCAAAGVLLRLLRPLADVDRLYITPLAMFAICLSWVAAIWMTIDLSAGALNAYAVRMAWVSVLWIVLAFLGRWALMFALGQGGLMVAACAGLQSRLFEAHWFELLTSPWREPWVWQGYLLVVAGSCLGWAAGRAFIGRFAARANASAAPPGWLGVADELLNPTFLAVDRWVTGIVLLGLVGLALWSALPGAAAEQGWLIDLSYLDWHAHAAGMASWILLVIVALTLALRLMEGSFVEAVVAGLALLACGIALVAARFEGQQQVVGAWRVLAGLAYLLVCAAIWARRYWLRGREMPVDLPSIRLYAFALFAGPAVFLTATLGLAAARGDALAMTQASDVWVRIVLLGPLLPVVMGLVGNGLRERDPGYAVASALFVCVVVTGVELCGLNRAGSAVSAPFTLWLVQLNVLFLSLAGILWPVAEEVSEGKPVTLFPRWLLVLSSGLLAAAAGLVVGGVWVRPGLVSASAIQAGSLWGIGAAILTECALWRTAPPSKRGQRRRWGMWVLFGATILPCTLGRFDTGNWLCFHALMVALALGGWVLLFAGAARLRALLGVGWQETFDVASAQAGHEGAVINHDLSCAGCSYNVRGLPPEGRCPECSLPVTDSLEAAIERLTPEWAGRLVRVRSKTVAAVLVCVATATVFALRAALDDPQRPWWSSAGLIALAAACFSLASWAPRRVVAYLGGAEIALAASIWWATRHWQSTRAAFDDNLINLVNVNIAALVLAGAVWMFVERRTLCARLSELTPWPAFHQVVALGATAAIAVQTAAALYFVLSRDAMGGLPFLIWLAWGATAALLASCYVGRALRGGAAGLYVAGLCGAVLTLAQGRPPPLAVAGALSIALAGYALVTTAIWRVVPRSKQDSPAVAPADGRLLGANALLGIASIALAIFVSFVHPEMDRRMIVALSAVLCAAGARVGAVGAARTVMQTAMIGFVAMAGVLLAWSCVPPGRDIGLLHRAIAVVGAAALTILASSGVAMRLDSQGTWSVAVRRAGLAACFIGSSALLYCAGFEANALMSRQSVGLARWAVAVLAGALPVMAVGCIVFAVRERLDPLRLTAATRGAYIYVAEGLGALFVLHLRATMPWLFSGMISQYWPVLVMGLAFAAAGAGEACARRDLQVAARPLSRTGLFLPVLALLEFFIRSSQVNYAIVLLTFGAFYAVLAGLRRSVGLALLAALALNASLWHLLQHTPGLGLTEHPQLWFIPPALAVLAATHLNRTRLSEEQRRTLHYGCLLAIYLSSTADIFLIGVARAPWLPLVLAGLSLAGIFVGFAFRVRSFLLMGVGFLCLSMLTMIWHAAANLGWTWVWYVSGIVLGVAIITVFAFFEKKRNEMSAWLDDLKDWAA